MTTIRGEGWYADPQDAQKLRWWDGAGWTPHTHDPVAPAQPYSPLPRWWRGVTVALQVALLLSLAAATFTLYVDLQILGFVDDVRFRPDTVVEADGARIDRLVLLTGVEVVALLITGVLFVAWLYSAHHSSRMDRSVLKHGSGWAIGGWFVPVLGLWRPFQMVTDVRRGATGDSTVDVPRTQGWWWGTWTLSYVLVQVVSFFYAEAARAPEDDPGAYLDLLATAASWERFTSLLTMAAAVLCIFLVRQVRDLVLAPPADA